MTIHDEIDSYLVADLHHELSEQERHALHTHLVECAACRQFHQENKIIHKILEENLTTEKADPAFEQRIAHGANHRGCRSVARSRASGSNDLRAEDQVSR